MFFYEIISLAKDLYRLTSQEGVFMDLIIGEKNALLFDTGWGFGNLLQTIREITDKPLIIVNSHGHVDHTNGNYQFEQEKYIHPNDVDLCQFHTSQEMRQHLVNEYQKNDQFSGEFDPESYLQGRVGNLKPVSEGMIFELGGKTLEVIELPGHTAGSIGLLYREEKMLFAGDAINGFIWLFLPESLHLSEYIKTLEKAQALDFSLMLQSHRRESLDKSALSHYLKAARELDWDTGIPFPNPPMTDAEVRTCIIAGKTMADFNDRNFASIVISRKKLDA